MSRRGSSTRPRALSESGTDTPKSRNKDVADSIRRSRNRANIIDHNRVQPQEQVKGINTIPQSTPINSPLSIRENVETVNPLGASAKIRDEFALNYQTTPLAESAGTALISGPENLPIISENSSLVDLNNYLDALIGHINDFENNLVSNSDWRTSRHPKYKFLSDCLSQARVIGIDQKFLTISLRCSEISAKLEEAKMNLSLRCKNDVSNGFHGFSTITETSNNGLAINNATNKYTEASLKDIPGRISALETHVSSFNSLKVQFPQIGERVAVLEATNSIDYSARLVRLEQLCANLNSTERLAQMENRIAETEARTAINDEAFTKHQWEISKLIQIKDSMERELNFIKKSTSLDIEELRTNIQNNAHSAPTFCYQNEPSIQNRDPPPIVNPPILINNINQRAVSTTAAKPSLTTRDENISKWLASSSHQISQIRQPPDNSTLNARGNLHTRPSRNDPQFSSSCHQVPDIPIQKGGPPECDDAVSVSSTDSSKISSMNVQSRILKSNMKGLRKLLHPNPLIDISKCTLTDIYKNRLITADIQCRELKKDLKDYFKVPNHDLQLVESVSDTIEDCINWCAEIREMYHNQGIHKKSQATKLYDTLHQFTKHSEVDIYDFFRRFSAYTEEFDIPEEKAHMLYNKFLAIDIQDEVAEFKHDFNSMKKVLIHRYGDLKTITSDVLLPVSKCTKPNNHTLDSSIYLDYYRRLNSAMQKINNLLKSSDVPEEEAKEYIFSQDFMNLLLSHVPHDAIAEFVRKMHALDEDTVRIKGKTAFKILLNVVLQCFQIHDTNARAENLITGASTKSKKEKAKRMTNLHASHKNTHEDSESDDNLPPTSSAFQGNAKEIPRSLPINKLKFPCLIENHNHEINECREFFFKTPKERLDLRKKVQFKYCLVCLQSSELCYSKKCDNIKSIPKELICKDCKNFSKTTNKPWYSILFCFSEKHHKPSNSEILQAFEKYIPGFKPSMLNAPINLAAHFQILSGTKLNSSIKSNTGDLNPMMPAPAFNTSTGTQDTPLPVDIISEIRHDSIGVMQYLNLNGKNVLVLYDRGANQHLVEGDLAEKLGFKVFTKEPCAIGVVSGSTVVTEYGSYQMLLGPTDSGKYFELVAQGISAITSKVAKYDLTAVNSETKESTDLPLDTPLPTYIGDQKIGLLIGLKSPELEPVCVFTLPSGIGLYKSPFKDIFGSYYCYGGPHESFSNINKQFHGSANHFNVYFSSVFNQYRNSLYPSLLETLKPDTMESEFLVTNYTEPCLPYSYLSSCGQKVFPTPLTANDFTELGQSIIDEKVDDTELCPNQHCLCLNATVFRAKIPLSKQRCFIDEADIDDTINFRCDTCKLCKCSLSNRGKLMSLNEKIEQEIIEESVTINLEEERVYVDLPFVKPVDDLLSKKHKGTDNLHQAKRVYKSQCKYPDEKKDKMRTAFQDLVDKGFMRKITDLPKEHQDLINQGKFLHYMPWRVIEKDSESTPLRFVVDPTMTGLNLALAKGQNKLRKIQDMLIRARTKKYMWTSDISKLYNRLYLKPSSYRYQLFLFGDELDPDKEPEVYVMIRAWYGVTSSANQSSFAIEELARLLKEDFPLAFIILTTDTYVDDMLGGSDTIEECNEQIDQVLSVLKAGGFSTKFVIITGQDNIEDSIKVLGYKWFVKSDLLAPGFSEVNFNPKKRGHRDANPFPVHTPDDISKLLDSSHISRRMVVSKISEFWDPCGLWEPYKLQLKLSAQMLNGLDWDSSLSDEMQSHWTDRFKEFLTIPNLSVKRCVIPDNAVSKDIRLICISDAAEFAGGGAIYAGVKLIDGTYSCKLVASKSRLMSGSVPRNELEAIRITAGLALDVKTALGDSIKETIFVTDSSIALSWCHNTSKRLRLYCLNRVMEIRRLIKTIVGDYETLPLFHIDGKQNPADYVTKQNSLKPSDLTEESIWVSGFPWMVLEVNMMPLTSFSDIQLSAVQNQLLTEECFPEVKLPSCQINHLYTTKGLEHSHCAGCLPMNGHITLQHCYGSSIENPHCIDCNCKATFYSLALKASETEVPFIDIVHHGYQKSIKIMANVIDFTWYYTHRSHCLKGLPKIPDCKKCNAIESCNGIKTEYSKILKAEALEYFFRLESRRLESVLSKDQLSKFIFKNGIYYSSSRIPEDAKVIQEDLDFTVFFDGTEIKSSLPVVSSDSPLFFALLMHIHHTIRKHAGIEPTLKAAMDVVYPINNPRRIIQAVRKHCPRCRLILRKTLELEIGQHPQARFQIVPAFYHSMCDIVYGFNSRPFKESKIKLKVYAIVIVCLLTSATSILALEGLETQDVVMAIERHSSRYGVPSCLFVDQGTQLINLAKVKMNIRDAHLQLKESLGINIIGSTAKSHCERGRAERKIRTLRDMLKKSAISTDFSMTPMQWETVFSKMSSEIDDIPIARADGSSTSDFGWDILTPNRFKLGRSNHRAIEGPMYLSESSSPALLLKRIKCIQSFWYQLLLDRIHHLIPRNSKWDKSDKFEVGDIIVFRFKDSSSSKLEVWKVGKIVEIIKGGRGVLISFPTAVPGSDKPKIRFVERCPRDISIISALADLNLNSSEFFNKINKL